jgi:GTP-binding protein Era
MSEENVHRSGYVALIGRPNVGKSTLLNALCKEKVAAVSPKPQTTRNRILGIHTREGAQVVFLDTPGIHEPHTRLNEYMVGVAEGTLADVDVIYFLVDFPRGVSPRVDPMDASIAERLRGRDTPTFLVANKVDLFRDKAALLPWLELYAKLAVFTDVFPVSAMKGDGIEALESRTIALLPEGPQYYPADSYTDQPERFLAAEIVREKIFLHTKQELPYASAVTVEAWTEADARIEIEATIHVERASQKGIVIGQRGQMLKRIGTEARLELERVLGARIHLRLFVRVEPDWRKDARALRKLGYDPP